MKAHTLLHFNEIVFEALNRKTSTRWRETNWSKTIIFQHRDQDSPLGRRMIYQMHSFKQPADSPKDYCKDCWNRSPTVRLFFTEEEQIV